MGSRRPTARRSLTNGRSGGLRSGRMSGLQRVGPLLHHAHGDLHDASVMLHPAPHHVGREPLLLFSALLQEVLRHLRRLTHQVDPGGPNVRHRADGSLRQGSNRLEVWNQGLNGVDVGVGYALDFRPCALRIVHPSLSGTKDARLSCGGCARAVSAVSRCARLAAASCSA